MRTPRALLSTFAAVSFSASLVSADPISFGFTMRVEQSQGPIEEVLGASVSVGDTVRGTITLDGDLEGFSSPTFGSYTSTGDPFGIQLELDGNPTFESVLTQILLSEDTDVSHLMFVSHQRRNGYDATLQLTLRGPEPGTITTALPRQAPPLDLFRDASFRFHATPVGVDDQDITADQFRSFSGPVTSLTDVAPIPEPGTLLLVGSGVAAAVRFRRRRVSNGLEVAAGGGTWIGIDCHRPWSA